MRGGYIERVGWRTEIIDEETVREVGFVDAEDHQREDTSIYSGENNRVILKPMKNVMPLQRA